MRLQGLVTGSRPATPEWAMTWAGDLSPHQWVRHLFAALELGSDTMYGHIKKRKRRGEFLEFCRYLRSLHPPQVRIAIVCDNFGPHLSTRKAKRAGQWAAASSVEIAYTPGGLNQWERKTLELSQERSKLGYGLS